MDKFAILYLACILAGFALINLPLENTGLLSFHPVIFLIGVLAVLFFSFVLIVKGIMALVGK